MIKSFFHIHRSSHKGGRRTRGSLRYRRFTYRFMPVAERIRLVVGILSMLAGFAAGSFDRSRYYPTDSLIIS